MVSEDKKRIQISLTKEQDELLVKIAKEKGFSKSAVLVLALEEYSKKIKESKK